VINCFQIVVRTFSATCLCLLLFREVMREKEKRMVTNITVDNEQGECWGRFACPMCINLMSLLIKV
jgi:hypothetical protein